MSSSTLEQHFLFGWVLPGGYEIQEYLGGGGFGQVFKAKQQATGQSVAIKLLRAELGLSTQVKERQIARFRRELALCAQLNHPHIVQLIDSGEVALADGRRLFTVFEFVSGQTLTDTLAERPLSITEVVHVMAQVLDGLACAHANGIIHRDLKPDNIMVSKLGAQVHAKIVDFGVGAVMTDQGQLPVDRITLTNEAVGTPPYSAPEQLRGDPPTPATDLYAWGLVFLECLTGQVVMKGSCIAEVLHQQLSPEAIPLPGALRSHRLGNLLRRTLEKNSRKRAQDASALYADLTHMPVGELLGSTFSESDSSSASISETVLVKARSRADIRRQITVLVCGVSASSQGVPTDFELVDELLHDQRRLVEQLIKQSDGTPVVTVGNRTVAYFGYPKASDTACRLAAHVALELTNALRVRSRALERQHGVRLEVRIGLHTGMVVVHGLELPCGTTPDLALQLGAIAQAGEVLVTESTRQLLARQLEFELTDCESRDSKLPPVFQLVGGRFKEGGRQTFNNSARPLLGRSSELAILLKSLEQAVAGRGEFYLVQGEAGIGKSRLVRELERRCDGQCTWLEARCRPEHAHAALAPLRELVLRKFSLISTDSEQVRSQALERELSTLGFDLNEAVPLFHSWLDLPLGDRYAELLQSPQRKRELLLESLVALLRRWTSPHGGCFLFEDLHWADPTTLELLSRLGADISVQPLLFVCTARPEFEPEWGSVDVKFLRLERFSIDTTKQMVHALSQGRDIPANIVALICKRTDGVPLFVEELTRTLLDGLDRQELSMDELEDSNLLPSTLRDSMASRLDHLGAAQETAQLAALIGREFDQNLLRSLRPVDDERLRSDLAQMVEAGLVASQHRSGSSTYLFRHALLRDAAYESMTLDARCIGHRRVAEVLEERGSTGSDWDLPALTHHFGCVEDYEKAADYAERTANSALDKSEYAQASHYGGQALKWIARFKSPEQGLRKELSVNRTLTTAKMMTVGWASAEVKFLVLRAQQLLEKNSISGGQGRFATLWALAMYYNVRGEHQQVEHALLLAAEDSQLDAGPQAALKALHGHTLWAQGKLKRALDVVSEALALYNDELHCDHAARFGHDTKVLALGVKALCRAAQGLFVDVLHHLETAKAQADSLNSLHSQCMVLIYRASCMQLRGDREGCREAAQSTMLLAEPNGLGNWIPLAEILLGWALNEPKRGAPQLQKLESLGAMQLHTYWGATIAEAELEAGCVQAAADRAAAGLELAKTSGDLLFVPELRRVRMRALCALSKEDEALDCLEKCVAEAIELGAYGYIWRTLESLNKTTLAPDGPIFRSGIRTQLKEQTARVQGLPAQSV